MINNPPICKIAIYSAQARPPNLRNTAVKTVPGGAGRQRCASIGLGQARPSPRFILWPCRKRAVAAAARQRPRLLLLLDFAGDFDYPAGVAIITEANASTAKSFNRPVEMNRAGPHFHPVVVLLTRLTTSATFAPKASAVFKSPGIISSTEASEGETTNQAQIAAEIVDIFPR
jgi:hypothetical protein